MFVTLFKNFEAVHLTKDVGMIPMAVAKKNKKKSLIVYWWRSDSVINNPYEDYVELVPIRAFSYFVFIFKFLIFCCKNKVKIVNIYHVKAESFFLAIFFKFIGLKTYLKLDMDYIGANKLKKKYEERFFFRLCIQCLINVIDYFSVEQTSVYQILLGLNNILAKKIKLIPNSIFTETVPCEPLDYKDRKNIILVVGRIGAYQKNHELILRSLDMIDNLGDWRIQFVGPIENKLDLSQFDNLNNKSIEFMGNFDRERMFQAYAEAKVFLLPSRWEGFSLALLEAAYMGCYIIGTDVGGVLEVTNNGIYGNIIKGDDETNLTKNLTSTLKSLISSDEEIRNLYSDRLSYVRKNFDLENRLESVEWSING